MISSTPKTLLKGASKLSGGPLAPPFHSKHDQDGPNKHETKDAIRGFLDSSSSPPPSDSLSADKPSNDSNRERAHVTPVVGTIHKETIQGVERGSKFPTALPKGNATSSKFTSRKDVNNSKISNKNSTRKVVISWFERYLISLNFFLSLGIFFTVIWIAVVILSEQYGFPLTEFIHEVQGTLVVHCLQLKALASVQFDAAVIAIDRYSPISSTEFMKATNDFAIIIVSNFSEALTYLRIHYSRIEALILSLGN